MPLAPNEKSNAANPFSMPAEVATFWLSETQIDDEESCESRRRVHVWEKQTAANKHNEVKKLRDSDLAMAPLPPAYEHRLQLQKTRAQEEQVPDEIFLTRIATKPSIGLAEPLKKNEKDVRTYISKKREVFLMNMQCDLKKKEIIRLDAEVKSREDALAKSQQMLDEDSRRFDEYLQERISRAQASTQQAEESTKRKQERLMRIKQVKQQISSSQSEIGKLREVREEMSRYKAFLDKLTPPEWIQQQRIVKQNRKALRKKAWVDVRLAVFLQKLQDFEAPTAASPEAAAAAAPKRQIRREQEEETTQKSREREGRKKYIAKKREEEEKRLAVEYVEVSSGEEFELYFKEPKQLLDSYTELEERNLFLIQSSQETEQVLDEINHTFEQSVKKEMGGKVQQLKTNIRQLEAAIAQEVRRGEQLKQSYAEKANTEASGRVLGALAVKVAALHQCCGLALDHNPDVMQMLGSIESTIEELISSMDEAFILDQELVMKLEWQKERERRDRGWDARIKEQMDKQDERLKQSLLRSQAPVFKKAGKQVMYRSAPVKREQKVVKDDIDDEQNVRDYQVFSVFIDSKTNQPMFDPPAGSGLAGDADERKQRASNKKNEGTNKKTT